MKNFCRVSFFAFVATAALGLAAVSAQAAPAAPGLTGADALNNVEQAQYIHRGRRYCWYPAGWHGPGWYWCGYASRRGYGWGGVAGWNGWYYSAPVVPEPRRRHWSHGHWHYY